MRSAILTKFASSGHSGLFTNDDLASGGPRTVFVSSLGVGGYGEKGQELPSLGTGDSERRDSESSSGLMGSRLRRGPSGLDSQGEHGCGAGIGLLRTLAEDLLEDTLANALLIDG